MRFNFEINENTTTTTNSESDNRDTSPLPLTTSSSTSPLKSVNVKWIPLQSHPISATSNTTTATSTTAAAHRNLLAWDGSDRLYYWNNTEHCLHRISIRLGEPEPASALASYPSRVLVADSQINFVVERISINRNGSALILSGSDGICVMYLYGRTSSPGDNAIVCSTVSVGSRIYFNDNNVIRMLRASWHPSSDTHVGILSSDSVFRIFDLSSAIEQPEQEYYLQPVEPGRSRHATSICPIDFSFGGDHLWDRFSVFVLFSDGSIYVLCPIVPFGSAYKWESVLELHSDAQTFGVKSANAIAVSNSNQAISWLEATFPELAHEAIEGESFTTVRARPYAVFDASLCLQGPLRKIHHGEGDKELAVRGAECQGHAVNLLYNVISKDSVLVTAWSGGQLQIDALADEIQPVWTVGNAPRVRVNSRDHILGLAMICESISGELPVVNLDQPLHHSVWQGHPPPLLRLAIVDLDLPKKRESSSRITLLSDPLMPERVYSFHDGGIDSIVLHFLPFTSQYSGKDETVRTPSVHPILSTCQTEDTSESSLNGFVPLADSFGYSWIVAVTRTQECIVQEMKTWNLLLPIQVDIGKKLEVSEGGKERNLPDIISKELLTGPNVVVPQASSNLRSVATDSIEGRSILHQYFKLFHENYVEYAHKVYLELKHHSPQLKKLIDDQNFRVSEAHEKLLKVEEKQSGLNDRIENAINRHNLLEQRLRRLRNLPGCHKKPLSRAERGFKAELDQFTGVELDALRTSIDTLKARLRRFTQSVKGGVPSHRKQIQGNGHMQDAHISQLKSSLAKLSLINSENSTKVKLVESVLKDLETER